MKLDEYQRAAVGTMMSGANTFLTGKAGTGKSTVTAQFIGSAYRRIDVCATTGIAALNLRDQFYARSGLHLPVHTIYRWAGLGIGPRGDQTVEEYARWTISEGRGWREAERRIGRAEVLVLDEVSMLPGRILSLLDLLCRTVRGSSDPFGGIQIIAVGDFLQLPPVSKSGVYDWAFRSPSWEAAGLDPVVLSTVHRQADPEFAGILNEVREGRISSQGARVLRSRVARFPPRELLRLLTHNVQVDRWNSYQMGCIEEPEVVFDASGSGSTHEVEFLRKNLVTPSRLALKVGARVMITANITQQGALAAVNGQLATVRDIDRHCEKVTVALDGGGDIEVEPREWQFDPQRQGSAVFRQVPLRPAWAITIHKAQGLSLPSAMVDVRAAREPGQAYVALSRVQSLPGLHLKDWFKGLWVSSAAIAFHREIEGRRGRRVGVLADGGAI